MTIKVKIESLAYQGSGIGKVTDDSDNKGKTIFVPFTVHGDEVEVEIVKEKKTFLEGKVVDIIKPSYARAEPQCKVFEECGGCQWQNVKYPEQMRWKHRIFTDTLKRIGKIEVENFDPAQQSQKPYNYRTKAKFQVSGKKWGFFKNKSHDVVNISDCPILEDPVNITFRAVKKALFSIGHNISTVEVGLSRKDKKTVVSINVKNKKNIEGFNWAKALNNKISGFENLKGFEVISGKKKIASGGETRLKYELDGISISTNISSFTQSNGGQNEYLVKKVLELAQIGEEETVLDLFCGAGNFTLPLSKQCGQIIGLDRDKEAIKSAQSNSKANSIENTQFLTSWAELTKAIEKVKPHVIILDPPREGDAETAEMISSLGAEKIIYISCSPPTLARDLSIITKKGYSAVKAGVIDMFPQTYHIEGFVLLEKSN